MPAYVDKTCKKCNRPVFRDNRCERHYQGRNRLSTRGFDSRRMCGPQVSDTITIDGRSIRIK